MEEHSEKPRTKTRPKAALAVRPDVVRKTLLRAMRRYFCNEYHKLAGETYERREKN